MPCLPERAAPFLEILRGFMAEPAMDEFGRGARRAFLGDEDEIEEDEVPDLADYVLFGHRDSGGRSLIDHFLSARGAAMAAEEREVIERFGASVYGIFQVEAVEPGRGFTLRRSGTDERFEVVEVEGSRTVKRGMGVFARLIPYRGRHEVSGGLRSVPPETAYVSERILARAGEAAAREAMDPVALRRLFKPRHRRPAPPENRLEAELNAASVFAELKFPLSVEEAQRRFQSLKSCVDLLRSPGASLGSMEDLQRLTDAITNLWNYTPRDELGGLSPHEKQAELARAGRPEPPLHLLEDLKNEVMSRIDPGAFPDAESRRAAIRAVQEEWLSTPQKELGGRTPREVMGGSLLSIADESSLPAPDRPAWPVEKIRELLSSDKPASALWAVRRAATLPEPMQTARIVEAVVRLLDDPDKSVVIHSLEALPDLAGHPAAPEVAEAVASRLLSFGESTHAEALTALARLAPSDHLQAFTDGLESGNDFVEIAALKGIAAGRSEGSAGILLGFLDRASDNTGSAAVALACLVGLRSADPARRGAEVLREGFACQEDVEEAILDVELAMGIAAGLFARVESALYPEGSEPTAPSDRQAVFLPRDDPAAARRAEEIVGPERAGEILALADAGKHVDLARLLGGLALEAIERASRENPAFEPLGRTLAGIARSVLEWDGLGGLEPGVQKIAASLLGAFLAKAVRGRDLARELEDAAGDPAKLLDLCRVDEPWVDERTFERLARTLGEEDLARLSACTDRDVAARRSLLLAAADPRRHLKDALTALASCSCDRMHLARGLIRAAGDSILVPLMDGLHEDPDEEALDLLPEALKLGTERAGVCLDLCMAELPRLGFSAAEVLEAACAAASRPAAEKAVALILEGAFDLEGYKVEDPDLYDTEWALQTCLEVLGIRGDARVILATGWRAAGGKIPPSVEEDPFLEDEDDLDEDDDEDGLFDLGEDDPDDPGPIAPIIRDAPKVGRNDPCPCGSGKKYKKCCGKG
jgi:hypothetical protein